MNIYISILIILVCLFFIFSATTAFVIKDKTVNLYNFQTYRWIQEKNAVNDPAARVVAEADLRMHDSIAKELNKWGWRETDNKPDVLISYDILVNKIKERGQQGPYTETFSRPYYNECLDKWSQIFYPDQFVGYDVYDTPASKATLTITVMEANTDKKIWQGWTTERLRDKKFTEKDIQRSVTAIFKQN
ncbi:MAG TPA: DUF4136 domain-containing protein [Chitinophagaceae bacterium]